uniref:Uncharacterized protein n=1 Tax=Lygus hesperus TaxID=30085 RepID=A0A0A9XJN2_LYGHE
MCCEGLIEKLPQLDTCCCCCRVETGSKVLAWLGTITAFLYTISVIVGIVALATGTSKVDPDKRDELITVGILVGVFLIIFLVCFWVMALLLLIGLYKEDMGKVRLWLRVNICLLFFGIVGVILNIITASTNPNSPSGTVPMVIVSGILQIALSIYFLSVVKSHYQNKTQGVQSMMA